MAKTVSPAKIQEWQGLNRIQIVTNQMKCVYREIQKDDFGIDGEIEVVVKKSVGDGYEATGGIIKFQSKCGPSYIKEDRKDSFSVTVGKDNLEYWYGVNFPVLLIVFHPQEDKLFFVEIKEYIRKTSGVLRAPYKIAFNKKTDEFSEGAYEKLLTIAGKSPSRVSFEERERLYSNLLLVKRLPNLITCSHTDFDDREEVFAEIKKSFPSGLSLAPFLIKNRTLFTIDDLRNPKCSLRLFCDTQSINDDMASRWVGDPARRLDFTFLLNQLLGKHTRKCGLAYNRHFKRTYFPRENQTSLEFRRGWHNVRTGKDVIPRLVAKYYEYGRDRFWRHTGSNITFQSIGDSWFLNIVPRYFFTMDGETPCEGPMVGPYATRIKAKEHNQKVLNDVLFWSDALANGTNEITMSLNGLKMVVVERLPISQIVDFAIVADPAVYEEDEEPSDFFQIWESDDLDAEIDKTIYVNQHVAEDLEVLDAI